jgi:hypothetical protein
MSKNHRRNEDLKGEADTCIKQTGASGGKGEEEGAGVKGRAVIEEAPAEAQLIQRRHRQLPL